MARAMEIECKFDGSVHLPPGGRVTAMAMEIELRSQGGGEIDFAIEMQLKLTGSLPVLVIRPWD